MDEEKKEETAPVAPEGNAEEVKKEAPEIMSAIMDAIANMGAQLSAIQDALSGLVSGEEPVAEGCPQRSIPAIRAIVERSAKSAAGVAEAVSGLSKASEKLADGLASVERRIAAIEESPVVPNGSRFDVSRSAPSATDPMEQAIVQAVSELPPDSTVEQVRARAAHVLVSRMHSGKGK